MSIEVTLTLDNETYRRAQTLAQLTGRNIADVLSDTLDISLQPLGAGLVEVKALSELSDSEILALADSQMNAKQYSRFSELLELQEAGKLITDELRAEFLALMHVYQEGSLHKAQALNEAVQRGLRKSLEA